MSADQIDSQTIHLSTEEEQLVFASRVAGVAAKGLVIFLNGDLGTGKTTFVRGFLRALNYEGVVKSPTYTLVEPYDLTDFSVYHFDLYRLADPEEIEYAGGRDYFDGETISLIEWPEKAQGFLPDPDLVMSLEYADSGRNIEVSAGTERGKKVMLALFPD